MTQQNEKKQQQDFEQKRECLIVAELNVNRQHFCFLPFQRLRLECSSKTHTQEKILNLIVSCVML